MQAISSSYGKNPFMTAGMQKTQQPQNTNHAQALKQPEELSKSKELNSDNRNREMAASQMNPMASQKLHFNA